MKLSLLTFAVVALAGLGAGQALATTSHAGAAKTLRVVMHDPGCHWFAIGGKFKTSTTVTGSVRLLNMDEATLKATSATASKRIPVGRSVVLARGHYVITMVGQAPDDNHLKLTVR